MLQAEERASANVGTCTRLNRLFETSLRACLHEGGEPQVGEVTRLGRVTRLST